jgi:putative hemolysin
VLLAFSAFFSGSEAALFSLTPGLREELKATSPGASRRVEALLDQPTRLLGTLLLGNLLVNTSASALVTIVLITLAHRAGQSEAVWLGLGGIAMTAVLLVFGEVTPKLVATRRPAGFARLVTGPVALSRLILAPFVTLLLKVSARFTPRQPEPATLSDDELHTMIEIGRERDVIHGNEESILLNLVDLDRRTVSEVMTPRIDIVALPEDAPVREAIVACRTAGLSRLLVYHGSIDNVTGTIHAKELLVAPDDRVSVATLARPAYLVPEVKKLPELLDELRRKGSHIAVVVDEFGQTAGLVTLEDLLEAVFGEISDEFDVAEELPYCKLDESSYLVDGEIDIATLNRLFRNSFRKLGHERLASFIHDRLGRLPGPGDTVSHHDLEITVREVVGNKLEKVQIRRKA